MIQSHEAHIIFFLIFMLFFLEKKSFYLFIFVAVVDLKKKKRLFTNSTELLSVGFTACSVLSGATRAQGL